VCAFMQCNLDRINADTFDEVTANLLYVDPEVAMDLIDLERLLGSHDAHDTLSCLQQRCIASLASNWKDINTQAQGKLLTLAKKQSPLVLTEILAGILSHAQEQLEETEGKWEKTKKDLNCYTAVPTHIGQEYFCQDVYGNWSVYGLGTNLLYYKNY